MKTETINIILNTAIFILVLYPVIKKQINAYRKSPKMILRRNFACIKRGEKPSFTGLQLTRKQLDALKPYIKDENYLKELESRIPLSPSPFWESNNKFQVHHYNTTSEEERKQNEFERVPSESSRFS